MHANEAMERAARWMQRIDPNGDYDGVTAADAPALIEILNRWRSELPANDPLTRGCDRMIKLLMEE